MNKLADIDFEALAVKLGLDGTKCCLHVCRELQGLYTKREKYEIIAVFRSLGMLDPKDPWRIERSLTNGMGTDLDSY